LGTDYTCCFITEDGEGDTADLIEAGNANSPRIAIDGSGNAIAVCRHDDGTGIYHITANRLD